LKKLPTLEELEKIITKEGGDSPKTAGVDEQIPSGVNIDLGANISLVGIY